MPDRLPKPWWQVMLEGGLGWLLTIGILNLCLWVAHSPWRFWWYR